MNSGLSHFRGGSPVRQQPPTCVQAHRNLCSMGTIWVDVSLDNITYTDLRQGKGILLSLTGNTFFSAEKNKPILTHYALTSNINP